MPGGRILSCGKSRRKDTGLIKCAPAPTEENYGRDLYAASTEVNLSTNKFRLVQPVVGPRVFVTHGLRMAIDIFLAKEIDMMMLIVTLALPFP